MSRREYAISIVVNRIWIRKVIIDPHYESKHAESITDELVIDLVRSLHGKKFVPVDRKEPYAYFEENDIRLGRKLYKLIWLLEDAADYIGVVNAYRR